ncbi:hypothetical protein [Vibrio vulnificus YJ016]|uniref:Uncharacterized protein n=1 Tax=Vibrio vulnificus (strain YJ016) TaxID=196600 RepID=Q7MIH7_VIBVY|nr:hypothetical protein [Vibrio vulnificus YJ016]
MEYFFLGTKLRSFGPIDLRCGSNHGAHEPHSTATGALERNDEPTRAAPLNLLLH